MPVNLSSNVRIYEWTARLEKEWKKTRREERRKNLTGTKKTRMKLLIKGIRFLFSNNILQQLKIELIEWGDECIERDPIFPSSDSVEKERRDNKSWNRYSSVIIKKKGKRKSTKGELTTIFRIPPLSIFAHTSPRSFFQKLIIELNTVNGRRY